MQGDGSRALGVVGLRVAGVVVRSGSSNDRSPLTPRAPSG
jgi:hypothetical protein